MFEQLPPHDVQAEESVIASIMVADCIDAVSVIVEPAHFFREAHAWTFEAALALHERGEASLSVTCVSNCAIMSATRRTEIRPRISNPVSLSSAPVRACLRASRQRLGLARLGCFFALGAVTRAQ